ncbi:dynactin subunit 6-like [Anneissia japonica]|uniref:dynactin subunit 6-like n=1 Tax=Anneissia japonica TaxID=1529436 RepID=UPI001425B597|nr:dynactin subunit 6-like [Anneissia japonica]
MSSHHRPSVKIAPGAVVCVEAELKGDITVGARTVIHPKARIIAEGGPIIIGESNLIEEQVVIINKKLDKNEPSSPKPAPQTMIIGANNVMEVGSRCEALRVGNNNIIESKAVVGHQTELSSGCIVGAFCQLTSSELLPENTVIFGENCSRRQQAEKPQPQTLQLDFLMKILPNYHHLKKSTKIRTSSSSSASEK